MATFKFRALTDDKKIKEATLSAKDEEEAGLLLQQRGLTPISIQLKKRKKQLLVKSRISLLEKITFARFLGLMLRSGLSMSEGVEAIASETKNSALQRVLNDLSYGLRSGKSVSTVLERYPNIFDEVFISILKSGEASGTLAESFSYLADKLRSEYELSRQIKGAMVYPIVIFTAMIGMGLIMTIFVLPRIGGVFETLNVKLPLPTRILIATGTFLQENIFIVVASTILILVLLFLFVPRQKLKKSFIFLLMMLPVTRKIILRIDFARFTKTLGVLVKSGVSITQAVELALSTVYQSRIRDLSGSIKRQLIKGVSLSESLKQHKIFPVLITQMLTVGEKSGSLDEVLEEVGSYYKQEAADDLKNISQVIEPILILVVGILVGLLVISIIGPIYTLIGDLQVGQ